MDPSDKPRSGDSGTSNSNTPSKSTASDEDDTLNDKKTNLPVKRKRQLEHLAEQKKELLEEYEQLEMTKKALDKSEEEMMKEGELLIKIREQLEKMLHEKHGEEDIPADLCDFLEGFFISESSEDDEMMLAVEADKGPS